MKSYWDISCLINVITYIKYKIYESYGDKIYILVFVASIYSIINVLEINIKKKTKRNSHYKCYKKKRYLQCQRKNENIFKKMSFFMHAGIYNS